MAFNYKKLRELNSSPKKNITPSTPKNLVESLEFTKEELEIILNLVANSTFEGKDVQAVYDIAVKLQKKITNL